MGSTEMLLSDWSVSLKHGIKPRLLFTYPYTIHEYTHLVFFSGASNIKMITVYNSSDEEEDCIPAFDFKLPDCTLPDFLDIPLKWSECVYETDTLHLWCDLMLKIESYSPLYLSETEMNKVIRAMAEDIVYIHGMATFFLTGYCNDCGIVHSVSIFFS